jgi:hypothetical protein
MRPSSSELTQFWFDFIFPQQSKIQINQNRKPILKNFP